MRKRPPILVVPNIIRFLLRSFQATAGVLLLSAGLSAAEITPPQMAKEAAKLDQLISAILKKSEKSAPAPIDDATFLRRASLVAIGRIPTLAEIQKFNADPAPNKRPVPRRPRLEMGAHRLLQSCRLHSRKKQPRPTRLPQRPRTLRQQVFRKGIQSPRPPPPSLLQRRHRPICRQRNRSRQRLRPHQAPR